MKHGIDKAYAALCSPCALLCFVALLLLVPQAYARQSASGVGGTTPLDRLYHHTVWMTEQGLLQNSINAIIQTHDGYLWLATFSGLARFDGITFTVFNIANAEGLVSDRIVSLYEDRAGRLWMGHEYGGLTRYQDGVFTGYTTAEGLPKGLVNAIIEDPAGNLWVATGRGLGRFTDGVFTTYTVEHGLPSNRVQALHIDQNGQLLVGPEGDPYGMKTATLSRSPRSRTLRGEGCGAFSRIRQETCGWRRATASYATPKARVRSCTRERLHGGAYPWHRIRRGTSGWAILAGFFASTRSRPLRQAGRAAINPIVSFPRILMG